MSPIYWHERGRMIHTMQNDYGSRFVTRDAVTEQRARKVITAFAACEYSHRVLRLAQFAGATVQFDVAWFAGYVQMKKIASEASIRRKATSANQKARGTSRMRI